MEHAGEIAHELENCKLSLHLGIESIIETLPTLLEELLPLESRQSILDKSYRRLFNSPPKTLLERQLSDVEKKDVHKILSVVKKRGQKSIKEEDISLMIMIGYKNELSKMLSQQVSIKKISSFVKTAKVFSQLYTLNDNQRTLDYINTSFAVESNFVGIEIEKVNLYDSMYSARRIVQTDYSGTNILISNKLKKAATITSYGDSLRILWINMFRNASQASMGKKIINVELSAYRDCFSIVVSNEGKSLPRKICNIYNNPEKLNKVSKRDCLGLKAMFRVVNMHGGKIILVSAGKRTVIKVLLPKKGV